MFDGFIRDHAHWSPRAPAVITPSRIASYAELNADVDRLGAGLVELGIGPHSGVVSLQIGSTYLLYAAILVALGSVCNSLKEAQNLMQPVMMTLFIPLVAMVFVTQEPNGLVAKVLSFIPLFTPFTMMNRAGGPPETWEYVATSALLLATIWLVMKAAGKVFRVGVLMTGNPPKLKEIFGWLRQS